jgi:predicted RNA binding protein YcfA (HicA-like mRNA interferase family)
MPPVPSVRGERVVRALEGAHQGRDLVKGTLRGILSDTGLTVEELQRLL